MADVLNLGALNWGSAFNSVMIWILVLVLMIVFGLIFYFIYDWILWNIYVEDMRQVGEPYYEIKKDKDGNEISREKKINYESIPRKGRLYNKKLKSGGFKEYFKVKGTNWDYINHYDNDAFYFRRPISIFDFKKKGIKLFRDPAKGYVPLLLSNPGMEYSDVTLNEVIGAISDSLYEREQLYGEDFWAKYGGVITVAFLTAFLVIGMIFIIKYQDVFWANSMKALQTTIQAVKETAAPALK